jgi:peptidoglycan hydrolase-like protein with peptidoglycan-binding domain
MKLRYNNLQDLPGFKVMRHCISDRGWVVLSTTLQSDYLSLNRLLCLGISSALLLIGSSFSMGSMTGAIASPPLVAQVDATARPILQTGSEGAQVSELQAILQLLGYYNGAIDGLYQSGTADAVAAFQQAVGLPADGIVGPVTWGRLLPAAAAETATPPVTQPTPTPRSPSPAPSPTPISNPSRPSPTPQPTTPSPSPERSQPPRPASPPTTNVELPVLRMGMSGPAIARLQDRLRHLGFYEGEIDGVFGPQTQAAVRAAQANFDLEADGVVGPATWRALLR